MENLTSMVDRRTFVNELIEKRKRLVRQEPVFELDINKRYPLSSAQTGIWIYNSLFRTPKFTLCAFVTIYGELDNSSFLKALEFVIRKHDIFGIKFKRDNNNLPYQFFEKPKESSITCIQVENTNEIDPIILKEANYISDLEKEKSYNFTLIKKSSDEHIFLFRFHHIIADAETFELFIKEVFSIYEHIIKGQEIKDMERAGAYLEYCSLKNENQFNLDYWKEKLIDDKLYFMKISKDKLATTNGVERRLNFELPMASVQDLKRLCLKRNTTLFTGLYTLFVIILFILSGEKTIYVTSSFSNRLSDKFSNCYGMFINNLLLKMQISYTDNFLTLLDKASKEIGESYSQNHLAFDELIRRLSIDPKYIDLQKHIVFTFIDKERKEIICDNLRISEMEYVKKDEYNALNIFIENIKGRYFCELNYLDNWMDQSVVNQIESMFESLIDKCTNLCEEPIINYVDNGFEDTNTCESNAYDFNDIYF